MKKLENKVAVITGGSSGIGLATAKKFVEEGAYVFITGRRQSQLDEAVKQIGSNVTAVQGDVTNLSDIENLYKIVKETKGHIDIILANAGVGNFVPLGSITNENFDDTFNLNVKGVVFTVQNGLPLLKDNSSIILTGSIAGSKAFYGMSLYGAAKAAIRSFARNWTAELKERGIRVNVLSPGPVKTPPFETAPKEGQDMFVSQVPMGRAGEADEIADVALFLASNASSYVTGVELFADGGLAQV
ncbi:SDR family NAD(P)-dependent oxidoreductase [Sphingobacterium sp. 18053]|uniref:SDR family NAD(P)-dependent oxidoreductase n=1 Tax=Sphingobacterium sp. 18053 TaxID=2681401 RepID=UPI0013589460|nr:SDR family oxidoreductase [Sphingobacterium sp. 18053]